LPRVSWLGPAPDDELLLVMELQLSPRRAAATGLIGGLCVLDDEALPAFCLGAFKERTAVARDLFADANERRLGTCEQPFEMPAALGQRQPAQVVVALAQEIERNECHRLFALD